ncbi:DUF2911 domain-containing protein [Rubrivirga sp. IMCC45206]|uniref:DUF2911 domain-containing protein n=1 Tax=Rubrivirga sp. IMCC45206 TaxID=3391614 RepID=UPI00398FCA55
MLRLLSLLLLAGCAAAPPAPSPAGETAAFVTRLGDDTLAVERFTQTPTGITATVALRAPETTLATYRLDLDDAGGLASYQAEVRQPLTGEVVRRETAAPVGDSLRVTVTDAGGAPETRKIAGADQPLPFIDMVHWPFELMVERAVAAGGPLDQPLFTTRGTVAFTSDVAADGGVTVRHPFRGPMAVRATAGGDLQTLDASQTTRKLTVTRVPNVDVEGAAARFAARDAAGQPFGDLSGRAEAYATIGGATVAVDYGQPQRRGREIWGALVPWGEVWRTGANRATHLTTDRALVLDPAGVALAVPAGEYTLFSIPQADGGVLIVNRQTGQGGTTYDPARDLGRVPLARSPLGDTVEAFTIAVEEAGRGAGRLALRWNRDAFSVPFAVAD